MERSMVLGALIGAWTLTSSCTGLRFDEPDGMSVRGAYDSQDAREVCAVALSDAPSPTARPAADRTIPVMVPPQAFAVYVPQHADPDERLWIGDHWIFIELTAGGFFAETVVEREPVSGGPDAKGVVSDAEAADLASRLGGLRRVVTPYKRRSP